MFFMGQSGSLSSVSHTVALTLLEPNSEIKALYVVDGPYSSKLVISFFTSLLYFYSRKDDDNDTPHQSVDARSSYTCSYGGCVDAMPCQPWTMVHKNHPCYSCEVCKNVPIRVWYSTNHHNSYDLSVVNVHYEYPVPSTIELIH